jgi:hypothetical protein
MVLTVKFKWFWISFVYVVRYESNLHLNIQHPLLDTNLSPLNDLGPCQKSVDHTCKELFWILFHSIDLCTCMSLWFCHICYSFIISFEIGSYESSNFVLQSSLKSAQPKLGVSGSYLYSQLQERLKWEVHLSPQEFEASLASFSWVLVAHAYNSSYSGGQRSGGSQFKTSLGKTLSWKKPTTKKDCHSSSRYRPWVQTPTPQKKKKEKKKKKFTASCQVFTKGRSEECTWVGHWWLTPVILVSQETEIRRIMIWSQPGQIVHKTLSQKNPSQ